MLGTDRSRSYCLEMICADFLAGATVGRDVSTKAIIATHSHFVQTVLTSRLRWLRLF
jgi:hypothetical protein